jgi:hypothetical protein
MAWWFKLLALTGIVGSAIAFYSFRINISTARNSVAATSITYHCVLSYDIWEEKFSVKLSAAAMKTKQPLPSAAATEAFERSLAVWPSGSQTRDRGLCLARLTTAVAVQGHTERSCEAGAQALTVARSTGSARIRRQLRSLYDELAPHGSSPAERDLRARLSHVA